MANFREIDYAAFMGCADEDIKDYTDGQIVELLDVAIKRWVVDYDGDARATLLSLVEDGPEATLDLLLLAAFTTLWTVLELRQQAKPASKGPEPQSQSGEPSPW